MKEKEIREMTLEEIRKTFHLENLNEREFKMVVMSLVANDVMRRNGLGDITPKTKDTVDIETKRKVCKEFGKELDSIKRKFGW